MTAWLVHLLKIARAALQSTSWGIGQIMGMNYKSAGFQNVEEMVEAMSNSEDQQLMAVGNFLISNGLSTALRAHDWASFARGYNGPGYAINRYDIRLNGEYQKYSAGVLPDLNVRAAQLFLTYLGCTLVRSMVLREIEPWRRSLNSRPSTAHRLATTLTQVRSRNSAKP